MRPLEANKIGRKGQVSSWSAGVHIHRKSKGGRSKRRYQQKNLGTNRLLAYHTQQRNFIMKRAIILLVSMGLGLSFSVERAGAASFTVQMTDSLTFSPASLSIAQGDTVTWTNVGLSSHTSTSGSPPSGDGLWASPAEGGHGAFSVTFTNFAPKAYPYFCSFHFAFGMTGTLTVTNSVSIPTPPLLVNPVWNNGQFQFTVKGKAGDSYVTETSQNFSNWLAVSTNVAPSDQFIVTDTAATNRLSFYRVRQPF
jgi:plastocyanin